MVFSAVPGEMPEVFMKEKQLEASINIIKHQHHEYSQMDTNGGFLKWGYPQIIYFGLF